MFVDDFGGFGWDVGKLDCRWRLDVFLVLEEFLVSFSERFAAEEVCQYDHQRSQLLFSVPSVGTAYGLEISFTKKSMEHESAILGVV